MRYKVLGKHTGLRISEVILGAGMFGTRWGHGAEPDEARRIFDAYAGAGGNFIDTANGYQFGQSEEILGDLLAGRREDFVVATKFSNGTTPEAGILATGNSRRVMIASAEASLKRLNTDRIDLFWVHFADGVTPMEEILRGLDDLVRAGKIVYAGLSNFPAWRVARAATIAELRNSVPIAAVQVEHSLVERTTELDVIPASQALGIGVVAWSPLGGGVLTGKYRTGEKGRAEGMGGRVFQPENSPQRAAILDMVVAIADESAVSPAEISIAWVAAKGSIPIIGPRTLSQLENNLGATTVTLSDDQIRRLDEVSAVASVYPYTVLDVPSTRQGIAGGRLDDIDLPAEPVA